MCSRTRITLILLLWSVSPSWASAQDADAIWHQFTDALLGDRITAERVRPLDPSLTEPLLMFLGTLRREVPAEQWERVPEVHRVGAMMHYVLPFTDAGDTSLFCFSLRIEGDTWYFAHLESIFIRLDTLSVFPASRFPDLPEPTKAWMRAEKYWSHIVSLRGVLLRERDEDYFLSLLKDGPGYFLEAKAWVPFLPPHRAFVLYLCWEQSVLQGNRVVLECMSDSLARLSTTPIFFQLYTRAAHLKGQISPDEYRRIYETIWQDRARSAGWTLEIEYLADDECVLTLRRP